MTIRPSPAEAAPPWHMLSAEDVARRFGSDLESGLTANDAAQRLARDGPNEIRE